jgi:glycosyltransferase involved in cell wall biosynthesis
METYLRDLVSYQSRRMQVEVMVSNEAPRTQVDLLDGARITRLACFGMVASQPVCPSLIWKLRGHKESVVHMHVPNPWAAQCYLMSGHPGKLVITHHADTLGRPLLKRLTNPAVRGAMKRAAAIIVTSKRYLETSAELAGFRQKCHVVPLGIDVDSFRGDWAEKVREIHEKYGKRLILAVARLVPYKGIDYLLEAMERVDATLLIIGKGRMREELNAKIRELGLGGKAHLVGPVDDTRPYYKASEMLLLPSVTRAESFGIVQVEAMAAGLPVINTDIDSGVPEVSIHGQTGITVQPRDPEALRQAITLLLENHEMRSRYGEAGVVRARKEFSAEQMAEGTLKVYEAALQA